MLSEFTGERVVPGAVDVDLWNEHVARYLFAVQFASAKRVLDLGSGCGYGTALLAEVAAQAIGIDSAPEALAYACTHYSHPRLRFVQASALALPFPDATFDLIVCFELIEHVEPWPRLLEEARRTLRPGGQFLVSTPNREPYAEYRGPAGPNPYHKHEFDFDEFHEALLQYFPHVIPYVQNHSAGLLIHPATLATGFNLRVEPAAPDPHKATFLLAVCALEPQVGAQAFFYLPATANLLEERARHIRLLEGELQQKTAWLEELTAKHEQLVADHRRLLQELETSNAWATRLDAELAVARQEIERLNREIAEMARAYEEKIAALETELRERTMWAQTVRAELDQKLQELAHCVEQLHQTEEELRRRTEWALRLDDRVRWLESQVRLVQASRWVRLGRLFGVGPEVTLE